MTESIDLIIKEKIENCGFKIINDFSAIDTIKDSDMPLVFMNINNIEVSKWADSFDGTICGAEVSGHICLRVVGIRHNKNGAEQLNKNIDKIVSSFCYIQELIITSIKREDIFFNKILGRREARIYIDFKSFITDTITKED